MICQGMPEMAIRARRGMLDILIHFSVYTEHIKIHNRGLSPIIPPELRQPDAL